MLCGLTVCGAQEKRLNVAKLTRLVDSVARQGVNKGAYPGCQIVVMQDGHAVLDKCYGRHSDRKRQPVRPTDLYDLASITKAAATTLAVMKLYEEGRLHLDDRASQYLPFLRGTDKENITLKDLLFHESGLPGSTPFYLKAIDPRSFKAPLTQPTRDANHPLQLDANLFMSRFKYRKGAFSRHEDATHHLRVYDHLWFADCYMDTLKHDMATIKLGPRRYQYSDLGFITLQWVVEAIAGESLADYVERRFYAPMGLAHTLFLPSRRYKKSQIIPTVQRDALRSIREMCGYTQDEVASFMGGVAGEAGLYSTAEDLARLWQMYLNKGELDGKRYLKRETCELFETMHSDISKRGLGFDRPDLHNPDNIMPPSSFGHGGFTGTNAWADPENRLVYVYLANRVSPYPWNSAFMDLRLLDQFRHAIYDSLE